MRVVHVIDGLGGSGGAENRLVDELLAFSPATEQLVVRLFEPSDLDDRLVAAGVEVCPLGLGSARGSYNWPLAVRKIRQVIDRFTPEIIHTSLFAGNLAGQLAARSSGLPVLSTMTLTADPALLGALGFGASSRRAAVMRRVAAGSARWSRARWRAITEDIKASNCRALAVPPERVSVIHRAVDERRATLAPDRGRFQLPPGPLFVNVARHAPQKGHLLLLEAFARIMDAVPDAQLVLCGRFTHITPGLRERASALGLDGRVHFLDFRADADVLMASADVFVFSSLAEGLGTAVLEAVAAGAPVVAFDIPPVREVTGRGDLATLVPVSDVAVFADAAIAALDLRTQPDLLERRRRWVLDHFDLQRIAGLLEGLLRELADGDVSGAGV